MEKLILEKFYEFISENKINQVEENAVNRTRHLTVVLEDIYQSHNASAVLRSCDCFGIQDVHIIENRNRYKINKDITLGSSKWLDLYKYNQAEDNTIDCIQKLKQKGYKIVATTPHTDKMLPDLNVSDKTAILFGTELTGLTQTALDLADEQVKIPMYGFTESLNISVSAALTLYDLSQRIRNENVNWQLSEPDLIQLKTEWVKRIVNEGERVHKQIIERLQNETN